MGLKLNVEYMDFNAKMFDLRSQQGFHFLLLFLYVLLANLFCLLSLFVLLYPGWPPANQTSTCSISWYVGQGPIQATSHTQLSKLLGSELGQEELQTIFLAKMKFYVAWFPQSQAWTTCKFILILFLAPPTRRDSHTLLVCEFCQEGKNKSSIEISY